MVSKEIEEIAKKDPMELTKEEIIKLVKAVQEKYTNNPSYEVDPSEVAEGLLYAKENNPEYFVDVIKIKSALVLGEYTPGKGIFKKKYADPFPKR